MYIRYNSVKCNELCICCIELGYRTGLVCDFEQIKQINGSKSNLAGWSLTIKQLRIYQVYLLTETIGR